MVKVKHLMGMALSVALISCGGTGNGFVEENVEFARKQIGQENRADRGERQVYEPDYAESGRFRLLL